MREFGYRGSGGLTKCYANFWRSARFASQLVNRNVFRQVAATTGVPVKALEAVSAKADVAGNPQLQVRAVNPGRAT